MSERAWLVRLASVTLIWVGGIEWLFGRVISRMAASPALEGIGRTVIEVIGRAGLFLISTAFLMALAVYFLEVLRFGSKSNRLGERGGLTLAIYLALFGVLLSAHAALSTFAGLQDEAWLDITFNVVSLIALVWAAACGVLDASLSTSARFGVALVALAYVTWYYSVLGGKFSGSGGPTMPGTGGALLFGEGAALLAPVLFFAATSVPLGRWRRVRSWIVPVAALLLFSAGNIADIAVDQGFTGVFTIWSVGFTLYLPWPLYAISLALFLHAVGTCFARRPTPGNWHYACPDVGMALLLLLYAGFYLQLTYQHLLAVLAVLLLGRIARPLGAQPDPVVESGPAAGEAALKPEKSEQHVVTT